MGENRGVEISSSDVEGSGYKYERGNDVGRRVGEVCVCKKCAQGVKRTRDVKILGGTKKKSKRKKCGMQGYWVGLCVCVGGGCWG